MKFFEINICDELNCFRLKFSDIWIIKSYVSRIENCLETRNTKTKIFNCQKILLKSRKIPHKKREKKIDRRKVISSPQKIKKKPTVPNTHPVSVFANDILTIYVVVYFQPACLPPLIIQPSMEFQRNKFSAFSYSQFTHPPPTISHKTNRKKFCLVFVSFVVRGFGEFTDDSSSPKDSHK